MTETRNELEIKPKDAAQTQERIRDPNAKVLLHLEIDLAPPCPVQVSRVDGRCRWLEENRRKPETKGEKERNKGRQLEPTPETQ